MTTHGEEPPEPSKGAPAGPPGAGSQSDEASIRRNTVFALFAQLTTGAFTAVLMLYLVRALGPDAFGVFALALGIGSVARLAADVGISQSVARFLAESRGDRAGVAALLGAALRLNLASAALVAGALFIAAGPLATAFDKPELAWPLRAIALSLFGSSVFTLYVTAFIALKRIAVNLRLIFLESFAETVASIALVGLGAGAAGAAFGRALGYFFGAIIAVAIVARLFGRAAVRPVGRGGGLTRQVALYAVPLFVTTSVYTLYAQADVLLIGALLGTTAVGLFSAPLALCAPLTYLGEALANSVAPHQARGGGRPGRADALQKSMRWLVISHALLLAPIIVWADPIITLLFGTKYAGSVDVLRILSVYVFLRGISPLLSTTVNYLGQARRRIPIAVLTLVVNVVIDIVLLPRIGIVGAAIGTGVAYLLYVGAHLRICRQELDLAILTLGITLLRALLGATVMGAVLYAVGTESLSLAEWLVGGAAGVIAFGTTLVVTGELSSRDLRRGRRAIAAGVSRLVPFKPS